MGGICSRCCCRPDNRKYLRTRYNVEREMSVEFDSLMDDDANLIESQQYGSVMTDQERKLLSERKFHDIVQYQRKLDAEIEEQLREQEERLRLEEESFYEAKRQAAQVAQRLKNQEQAAKQAAVRSNSQHSWLGKDAEEYEISGEDFEQFLENVRKRSLSTPTKSVPCQVQISSTETRSVSLITADESETFTQFKESKMKDVEEIKVESNTSNGPSKKGTKSQDFEWDDEFVSASVMPPVIKTEIL